MRDEPRILIVDADPALFGLLEEWLAPQGWQAVQEAAAGERFDLVLVDVAFPRQGGIDVLKRVLVEHAATPVLALSSGFFEHVESGGAVAHALGVAAVLPKPFNRDILTAAVRQLLPSAA